MKKEFWIKGDGKVQKVGFRPLLTSVGYLDFQVKVYASNVEGNKIKVLVEGKPELIDRFIESVKQKSIKPEELEESEYEVKENAEANENNHNYLEHTQALQLDQMSTFVTEAKKIGFKLNKLDKLDKLDNIEGAINKLPENIAKEMEKLKKNSIL